MKFAPGPWKLHETDFAVVDADGKDVELRRFALASGHRTQEERDIVNNNTRLAIASPALYAALKRIIDEFDLQMGREHVDEYHKDARAVLDSLAELADNS